MRFSSACGGVPRYDAGFSLVEVVFSLGLVAFALVSMLGLLNVGFSSGRQAAADTLLVSMASIIEAQLRADPSVTSATMTAPKEYYFNYQGNSVESNSSEVLYYCKVSLRQPSQSEVADVGANFSILTLAFSWPFNASSAHQTNEVIHVTIRK
jgi:uncharacterized protein (TIGR02598 family)